MEQFLDYIEKRRWGILVTFILHMALLLYLQIDTYSYSLPERRFDVMSEVIEDDYIELNPEQIILPEDMKMQESFTGDIKNIAQSAHDIREKSFDNFSRSSTDQKVEDRVRDLERQFFEEFASGRGGSESSESGTSKSSAGSGGASNDKAGDTKKSPKETEKNPNSTASSGAQFAGQTMVRYDLKNRSPHNNNDWFIRNPGYTCGSSSNGLVVVAIRVNQNGDVVSARYVAEMSNNANNCMIEQAEIYARKSRFAFKADAPKAQDGFIYYTFVSKK